jgi:LmbE family N-acetylglucosaminyl deacetylase
MIELVPPGDRLDVLCVGAHPDDVEIGCGGTLLELAAQRSLRAHVLIMTGSEERRSESRTAAENFLKGHDVSVSNAGLPDGRLPAAWQSVKEVMESCAQEVRPDLILAPRRDDSHQDHRLVAELVTTVWRDQLVLRYEIPKWDGDLRPVTHYVPVSEHHARRKVDLLNESYPSQLGRDWWDDDLFLGLMRLRGAECRNRFAEGFVVDKAVVTWTPRRP